jgi:DNA invertase Pin-like site-specific DNA recombinase
MKVGYGRVSTTDQKAVMQVQALRVAGVEEDRIFIDEMSGLVAAKDRPADGHAP